MAGSIAGALNGFASVPQDRYHEVLAANTLDIAQRLAGVAHML